MSKPLSREFLLERGKCCKNFCKNCPFPKTITIINEGTEKVIEKEIQERKIHKYTGFDFHSSIKSFQIEYNQLYSKAINLVNKNMDYKEFTLKDWKVEYKYKDKPGINSSDIILIFESVEPEDFKVGDRIISDFRDGQTLSIKNIENNKLTVNIITCDKEEYLNLTDLVYKKVFYKLPLFDENSLFEIYT